MTPLLAQRPRADRAFERIYRRHIGDVYRYALAVMRNEADAEDVAQTTFMNAYRAFQRGERPDKPKNWLIAIAHNVCRQRFRHAARRPPEVAFDDDVGNAPVEPDETPSADDIRRALGHLAFNQRAALVMRELEGRSYAEIGEILELSPSAVETLIFRARRSLREQLESSLTCGEAELAISRQLDGRLGRAEKSTLRAHLRECKACATFARSQRAQRSAIRSLAAIPVPASLTSLFGGGAGVTTGVAVKAAVALTSGVAIGGAGYAGLHTVVAHHESKARAVVTQTPVQSDRPRTVTSGASTPLADSPHRSGQLLAAANTRRRAAEAHRRAHGRHVRVAKGHRRDHHHASPLSHRHARPPSRPAHRRFATPAPTSPHAVRPRPLHGHGGGAGHGRARGHLK